MPRLYHPDHGWGSVVRMSADGRLLVNFPGALGTWVNPVHPGVTLEGAARLRQLKRPAFQWGYCWACHKLTQLKLVATKTRSGEGYECPHCKGVSRVPHGACPEYGPTCPNHPPIDPDGDPLHP